MQPTRPDFAYRNFDSELAAMLPELRALRRELHAHPELGYAEVWTAGKVAAFLEALGGWDLQTGVAETGIVATLGAELPGPMVALRADMDALPMEEASGVPHASKIPGVAHACGHDGHTVMLLGAARLLTNLRDELAGPVRLLFQPAEEGGAGGARMVEEGALVNPPVAAIFGLHNMPDPATQAGELCLCPGAAMAGTGTFTIKLHGVGGHAAAPHRTVDPIVAGAQVVTALQSIVARQIDPVASAVVSVTQFHAGSAFNVIPPQAVLKGTFRALDETVLEQTQVRIVERATGIASAMGVRAEIEIAINYPVLRNDARAGAYFEAVVEAAGRKADFRTIPPMLGGEDFAFYQQKVPGAFWFLAARPADKAEVPFCHHPAFDFNDDLIADGVRFHVETARRFARLWPTIEV